MGTGDELTFEKVQYVLDGHRISLSDSKTGTMIEELDSLIKQAVGGVLQARDGSHKYCGSERSMVSLSRAHNVAGLCEV